MSYRGRYCLILDVRIIVCCFQRSGKPFNTRSRIVFEWCWRHINDSVCYGFENWPTMYLSAMDKLIHNDFLCQQSIFRWWPTVFIQCSFKCMGPPSFPYWESPLWSTRSIVIVSCKVGKQFCHISLYARFVGSRFIYNGFTFLLSTVSSAECKQHHICKYESINTRAPILLQNGYIFRA